MLTLIEEQEEDNNEEINALKKEGNKNNLIAELGKNIQCGKEEDNINLLEINDANLFSEDKELQDKFISVIRPSNNFNLGIIVKENELKAHNKCQVQNQKLFRKISESKSPSNKIGNNQKSNRIHFNLDSNWNIKKNYSKSSMRIDSLKNDLKLLENSYNLKRGLKSNPIKQKLQDVFFQIQKPQNNYLSQSNRHLTHINPASMSSGYKIQIEREPIGDILNPYDFLSEKVNSFKYKKKDINQVSYFSKFINNRTDKPNDGDNANKTRKQNLFKKIEDLNQMLYSKPDENININGNILSEDDFVTLEEKIQMFENNLNKHKGNINLEEQNTPTKEKENFNLFDSDYSQIKRQVMEPENYSNNMDFEISSDLLNSNLEEK